MRKHIALLWVPVVVGFWTLPFWFLTAEQPNAWYRSHFTFHLLAVPVLAWAAWLAVRVARGTRLRAAAVMAWLVVPAVAVSIFGHVVEQVSVVQHGSLHAGEGVFDEPLHEFAANFSILGWLAAQLLVVVLSVTAAVAAARARRRTPVRA